MSPKLKSHIFFVSIHPKNLEETAKQVTSVWRRTSNKKSRLILGFQLRLCQNFQNKAEAKYSTKDLETLAIMWSYEPCRTYLFGNRLGVLIDIKAVISTLNQHYGKKSYQSVRPGGWMAFCTLIWKLNTFQERRWA